ncbi:MAG: UbiA family prenyltransferase [Desulfobulbaceae bacterium]|nr:UbiA family prenyltransferase [Desulfobulbaceae bacterium]
MTHALSSQSPFRQRLAAYLAERFPLINHGVLIVSYYSSNQFLAQVLTHPQSPVRYSQSTTLGAATLFCLFFHLRVFDEHKDYAEDLVHYPERLLSRGLISLDQLKIMGGIAITAELTLALWRSPAATVAVLLALAFSLLMLKEFFVGPWLRRHFLLYAVSHMFIMPLLALVAFSFTTGLMAWQAPGWFWLYALVGFFVSFNWEISRKIRAPEDERDGVDSYSKIFGTVGAANLVLIIRVIDTALVWLVGLHLCLAPWFYGVLLALFGLCLVGYCQFRTRPCAATAKRLADYAGLYIVAFDLTLAVALVGRFGITF